MGSFVLYCWFISCIIVAGTFWKRFNLIALEYFRDKMHKFLLQRKDQSGAFRCVPCDRKHLLNRNQLYSTCIHAYHGHFTCLFLNGIAQCAILFVFNQRQNTLLHFITLDGPWASAIYLFESIQNSSNRAIANVLMNSWNFLFYDTCLTV